MPDTAHIEQKLEELSGQLTALLEAERRRDELFRELGPIFKEIMAVATGKLDELERRGYFAFARGLLDAADRVVSGYSADDVADFADAIVSILDTVRSMTQPHVLQLAKEASESAERADQMAPVGVVGMVKASRDEDVQRGMAVMLDILRKVGQGAAKGDRRARLRAQLASRKKPRPGSSPPEQPAPTSVSPATRPRRASPQADSAPVMLDGVAFTQDGYLADPDAWSEELAVQLAASLGVEMTDDHWKLVRFARQEFQQTGASPNIRRLTQGSGLSTKQLYSMFPKAPGKCTALIAGLPKPVGCI